MATLLRAGRLETDGETAACAGIRKPCIAPSAATPPRNARRRMLILLAILSSLRLRPVFAVRCGPNPVALWSSIRFPLHPRNGHLQSKNTRPLRLVTPNGRTVPAIPVFSNGQQDVEAWQRRQVYAVRASLNEPVLWGLLSLPHVVVGIFIVNNNPETTPFIFCNRWFASWWMSLAEKNRCGP